MAAPLAARQSEKSQQSHGEAVSCQRNSVSPRNRPALVSAFFRHQLQRGPQDPCPVGDRASQ